MLLRNIDHAIRNCEIGIGVIHAVRVIIRPRALGLAAFFARAIAGEKSARQRAPRNHGNVLADAERNHLALFFAIDQVVMVLHRDESRSKTLTRRMKHL